ncbi:MULTISPECIES: PA1571 family protein [Pseudomonas]|uniref:Multifunctional fatty acid oxidation complex subunit alpha n=1 Tax=Pseudomonas indica TaxID=137658 RepID=A0A1G8XMJ9_9PSED|nr:MULTISPECIES: PA1571 family protein [Pseudomonas]MBU3054856.1 hypothetical protein [Pseudomonas indica]PAU56776.1 hypothetical protein BZL42_15250 [Pseudomonas indica]PAU63719.1 hypothetical protein BZL41_11745 [Pseudomonas sp. PIC25]SDJ91394.1 hypothetical protein SAMN05216186_103224 [Pseudomonas indica]
MSLQTTATSPDRRVIPMKQEQPVGGAIIDAQGREIPITETMIQQACRELHKAWVAAVPKQA